jgi:hypothetical protein
VEVEFRALAGLASPCPGATILLYAWPHETLSLLLWCLDATDRERIGTLGVVMELECTAKVFRQTCRSTMVPGIGCFSSRRAVFAARSVRSSS